MPHDALFGYLKEVEDAIGNLQEAYNELIFRYDNTPHFPGLPNFPNHKHHQMGVDSSGEPSAPEVIREAAELSLRYA
jgi:hypothetical protein